MYLGNVMYLGFNHAEIFSLIEQTRDIIIDPTSYISEASSDSDAIALRYRLFLYQIQIVLMRLPMKVQTLMPMTAMIDVKLNKLVPMLLRLSQLMP